TFILSSFFASRRRHTRSTRDWSSDVCSSDLLARAGLKDSASHVLVAARGGRDVDPEQELLSLEAFGRTLLGERDQAIDLLKRYRSEERRVGKGRGAR